MGTFRTLSNSKKSHTRMHFFTLSFFEWKKLHQFFFFFQQIFLLLGLSMTNLFSFLGKVSLQFFSGTFLAVLRRPSFLSSIVSNCHHHRAMQAQQASGVHPIKRKSCNGGRARCSISRCVNDEKMLLCVWWMVCVPQSQFQCQSKASSGCTKLQFLRKQS